MIGGMMSSSSTCGTLVMEDQQLDGLGGIVVPVQHVVDRLIEVVYGHSLGETDLLGEPGVGGQGEPEQWIVGPQPLDRGECQRAREPDGEQRLTVGQRTDQRPVGHHAIAHRRPDSGDLTCRDDRRAARGEDDDHAGGVGGPQGHDGALRQFTAAVQQGAVEVGGDQAGEHDHSLVGEPPSAEV